MKKSLLLLTVFASCFTFVSNSQVISKGDKLFGAGASVYFYNLGDNNTNYRTTNVAFVPSYAWAIKKDMAIGVSGNIQYSRSTAKTGTTKTVHTVFQAGPEFFLKKYKELKNGFGLFFAHGINGYYIISRQKNEPNAFKSKIWGGGYSFTPGAFYKFSDSFLGEANVGGLFFDYNKNGNAKTYSAGASFLQYFNISINYIIGKKA